MLLHSALLAIALASIGISLGITQTSMNTVQQPIEAFINRTLWQDTRGQRLSWFWSFLIATKSMGSIFGERYRYVCMYVCIYIFILAQVILETKLHMYAHMHGLAPTIFSSGVSRSRSRACPLLSYKLQITIKTLTHPCPLVLSGAILLKHVSDYLGRRSTLLLGCVANAASLFMHSVAFPLHSVIPLVVGRFIDGVFFAIVNNVAMIFVSEIMDDAKRGTWNATFHLFRQVCTCACFCLSPASLYVGRYAMHV